jgi:hypothetical protein
VREIFVFSAPAFEQDATNVSCRWLSSLDSRCHQQRTHVGDARDVSCTYRFQVILDFLFGRASRSAAKYIWCSRRHSAAGIVPVCAVIVKHLQAGVGERALREQARALAHAGVIALGASRQRRYPVRTSPQRSIVSSKIFASAGAIGSARSA